MHFSQSGASLKHEAKSQLDANLLALKNKIQTAQILSHFFSQSPYFLRGKITKNTFVLRKTNTTTPPQGKNWIP